MNQKQRYEHMRKLHEAQCAAQALVADFNATHRVSVFARGKDVVINNGDYVVVGLEQGQVDVFIDALRAAQDVLASSDAITEAWRDWAKETGQDWPEETQ